MITVILTGALYVSRDFPFSADFPLPLHSARKGFTKREQVAVTCTSKSGHSPPANDTILHFH